METSTTNTRTTTPSSATYQCVVCQTTYVSLIDLHRHQSYRHTPEELSLSTIGLQCSAIKMFETPNGIVYDNSWLHDPSRHAEFYAYSSDMLCDENNNGSVVDCSKNEIIGEKSSYEPAKGDGMETEESFIDEESTVMTCMTFEPLFSAENVAEQESCMGEGTILDLTQKVSPTSPTKYEQKPSKTQMDVAQDPTNDPLERLCDNFENLNRVAKRDSSSRKCPVPRKVRRMTAKKKPSSPSDGAEKLKKQNSEDSDVKQERTFDSQDSASHFVTDEEKSRLPVAKKRLSGPRQQKPLNLTKVAKKTGKRNTRVAGKSENQNGEKSPTLLRVSKFNLEHFLTYLKDRQRKIDVKSERNHANQEEHQENRSMEEIQAENLPNEISARDALSEDNGNENSLENRSIFDPETPVSSSPYREVEIHTQPGAAESTFETQKSSNRYYGNEDSVEHSSIFETDVHASFSQSKEAEINAQAGVNAAKPTTTRKKGNISKTVFDNQDEENTVRESRKPSNEYFKNGALEHRSIFDSDVPASCSQSEEAEINAQPGVNAAKPTATRKSGNIPKTVFDNQDEENTVPESPKPSNKYFKKRELKHRSIFDPDVPVSYLESKEATKATTSAITVEKPIASRKKTKSGKTQANKSLKGKIIQRIFAKENSRVKLGVDHSSIFNSANFSSHYGAEEKTVRKLPAFNDKKRAASGTRAKNSKIMPGKLSSKETSRGINDPVNQDYGNDDSAKKNSTAILDVYSYTDSENEEATITTLSEFRAKKSAGFGKKESNENANKECCEHTFTDCFRSEPKIDALIINDTGKQTSPRKKSTDSRIASVTPVAKAINEDVAKLWVQDCAYENSVERNSIATPDVYAYCTIEEATSDVLSAESVEIPSPAATQTDDTETSKVDPAVRAAQKIDALFNELYENENSGDGDSPAISNGQFFACNANEKAAVKVQSTTSWKSPNVVAMHSAQTINDIQGQRCENVNRAGLDGHFAVDYCPTNSMSHSSTHNSAVTFVAYPPGLDERSVLIFDPEISHLVWTTFELVDSPVPDQQFDEMPSSGTLDNDRHRDSTDVEDTNLTTNVDTETSNTSSMLIEVDSSTSNGDSSSQNINRARRSTRTKSAIDRYVP